MSGPRAAARATGFSAPLRDHPYTLGSRAAEVFAGLGVDVDTAAAGRR
ncbi:hypothetical protein [Amycolatopsis sp. cmx-8-4]